MKLLRPFLLALVAGCVGSPHSGPATTDAGEGACPAMQVRCGQRCVETSSDAQNCGECGHSCADSAVCSSSTCAAAPTDCRVTGAVCPSKTFCEPITGKCKAGCTVNGECDANGYCDLGQHQCRCEQGRTQCGDQCLACVAPVNAVSTCSATGGCDSACIAGSHRCADACVMNTVNSCGETCAVCAAPLGGVATCDSTGCGSRCDQAGARACGTACVACPSDGVQLTGCEGNACVALSCKSAYLLRNGLCVPAWTIAKVVNKVVSSPLLTLSASGAPALAWVDEAFSSQAWVNGAKVPLTVERPAAIGFAPTGELLVLGRRASGAQWWIALETVGTPGSVIVSDGDTDPFGIDATATQTLAVGRVGLETKLFTRSSTAWVSEKVTGPSKGASVVVAADHSIWVLTDQGTSATLSRRVGSEWSHQALSATYLPTLAVKPDSAPVVAWGLKGPGFVVSNGTTQETVPLAGLYIADVAVATDAKGFVHVAVNAATSLRYSTNRSGSWVTEIVSRDMPANTPAIAVAANGQVHIAWTSFADSGLYSAVRSE